MRLKINSKLTIPSVILNKSSTLYFLFVLRFVLYNIFYPKMLVFIFNRIMLRYCWDLFLLIFAARECTHFFVKFKNLFSVMPRLMSQFFLYYIVLEYFYNTFEPLQYWNTQFICFIWKRYGRKIPIELCGACMYIFGVVTWDTGHCVRCKSQTQKISDIESSFHDSCPFPHEI